MQGISGTRVLLRYFAGEGYEGVTLGVPVPGSGERTMGFQRNDGDDERAFFEGLGRAVLDAAKVDEGFQAWMFGDPFRFRPPGSQPVAIYDLVEPGEKATYTVLPPTAAPHSVVAAAWIPRYYGDKRQRASEAVVLMSVVDSGGRDLMVKREGISGVSLAAFDTTDGMTHVDWGVTKDENECVTLEVENLGDRQEEVRLGFLLIPHPEAACP